MDDGEIDLSGHITGNSLNTFRAPLKFEDSQVDDDSLKNKRTCLDTHNKHHALMKPNRSSGNQVAVRKYREKKKAQNTYLEEEVKKLRVVNRGLIRKLQVQSSLEAEAVRLRRLLMNLRAHIGKELGGVNGSPDGCNGLCSIISLNDGKEWKSGDV